MEREGEERDEGRLTGRGCTDIDKDRLQGEKTDETDRRQADRQTDKRGWGERGRGGRDRIEDRDSQTDGTKVLQREVSHRPVTCFNSS